MNPYLRAAQKSPEFRKRAQEVLDKRLEHNENQSPSDEVSSLVPDNLVLKDPGLT